MTNHTSLTQIELAKHFFDVGVSAGSASAYARQVVAFLAKHSMEDVTVAALEDHLKGFLAEGQSLGPTFVAGWRAYRVLMAKRGVTLPDIPRKKQRREEAAAEAQQSLVAPLINCIKLWFIRPEHLVKCTYGDIEISAKLTQGRQQLVVLFPPDQTKLITKHKYLSTKGNFLACPADPKNPQLIALRALMKWGRPQGGMGAPEDFLVPVSPDAPTHQMPIKRMLELIELEEQPVERAPLRLVPAPTARLQPNNSSAVIPLPESEVSEPRGDWPLNDEF